MYTLYSLGTPNGLKPTILLEELQAPYKIEIIDIRVGDQFKNDFVKIAPNSKIPVIFDPENDFYLFESVAILQYLAEKHEQFLPKELKAKYQVLEWCFFQAAHIGPMFGQYGHFHRYATTEVPYAKQRYGDEVARLMAVMDRQLNEYSYISSHEYSIADIAIWPWVYAFMEFYETPISEEKYPHLMRWYETISKRPAIKAALNAYKTD